MTKGLVVVLGKAGRNFAAGMSGGFAYVLDEDGTFAQNVNPGMVGLFEPTHDDRALLRDLVERHHRYTGSGVAARLLGDWHRAATRFVKVLPADYAKVLAAQHLDTDEARLAAV
jgi:glutamate synthase domain-containing protein 3